MAKQQRIDPRTVERAQQRAAAAKAGGAPAKGAAKNGTASAKGGAKGAAARAKSAATPPAKGRGKSGNPAGRAAQVAAVRPATLGTWIAAGRPLTLLLAIAPVALGTGAASLLMDAWWEHWVRALLALVVAIALQVGVNYANDYSDGIRGVDAQRVGPARLVGSGRAKPRPVLITALVFFGVGAVAGAALIILSQQWWLFAFGLVAIAAAWFYTGGPKPYGYLGLGEVVVFVFFGLAPVVLTMLTQVGEISLEAWLGGVGAGALAAAVLVVNNLRDRVRDAQTGKRTIAVLLGNVGTRILYGVLMLVPFGLLAFYTLLYTPAGYVYFTALTAAPAILIVATFRSPRELRPAFLLTVLTALAFGVGLGLALAFPTVGL